MHKKSIYLKLFHKSWESPTITTWASYFTKSGSLLFVLPLILNRFSEAEVAVYYLFASIISFASLADFGFKNTFVRFFAYTAAGRDSFGVIKSDNASVELVNESNWSLAEKLFSMMKRIYLLTSAMIFLFAGAIGTYAMKRPINLAGDSFELWLAWFIILATSIVGFYGRIYVCYLEGFNKIALIRRIETLFSLGAILSKIIILTSSPSILNLVIVSQFWLLLNVLRNYFLSRNILNGRLKSFNPAPFNIRLFKEIWQPAWRSGVASLMSIGLSNFTSIVYAQIGSSSAVASYLLVLKFLTMIRDVSMAPFYSKIPLFAKLRAQNNLTALTKQARKGMVIAHSVYFSGVLLVGVFIDDFLRTIDSSTTFAEPLLYYSLAFAFFLHRYGGMHMQLYLTTNHIIAHVVDGITGLIFITLTLGLIHLFDVYVFPLAMIISYLSCHAWVSAKYSLKSLNVSFIRFEKPTITVLIISLIVIFIFLWLKNHYNTAYMLS
jgi:O-antigen/teichoic acid export membrane protein